MPKKRKKQQPQKGRPQPQSVRTKPKHFIVASEPAVRAEFERFLKGAEELQDASDRAFRLELATG